MQKKLISIRMSEEVINAVEQWAKRQPIPVSRSAAIEYAVKQLTTKKEA